MLRVMVVLSILWGGVSARGEELPGKVLFAAHCARCHGADGNGTEEHPEALRGDLSVAQLADVIQLTMPEDDPESLSAKDARAIAEYIHHSFYSPVAESRNKPPRIELARLTVRQHRRALADLIGSFGRSRCSGMEARDSRVSTSWDVREVIRVLKVSWLSRVWTKRSNSILLALLLWKGGRTRDTTLFAGRVQSMPRRRGGIGS